MSGQHSVSGSEGCDLLRFFSRDMVRARSTHGCALRQLEVSDSHYERIGSGGAIEAGLTGRHAGSTVEAPLRPGLASDTLLLREPLPLCIVRAI